MREIKLTNRKAKLTKPKSYCGYIVSLDAIIALLIAFFFFIFISRMEMISVDLSMQRIAMDLNSVLEKIVYPSTDVSIVVSEMPDQYCASLEIYNGSYSEANKILFYTRDGCDLPENEIIQWRTFVDGEYFYLARSKVWKR